MDLASVSSIGGGAVAFFPLSYSLQHVPPRTPSRTDNQLTPQELISQCEIQARRVRARGSDVYGALDGGESRRGALFCRSGTWLEILDEYSAAQQTPRGETPETVRGAAAKNTRYGLLDFVSVAIGLVSIRGVEANRYLCMNREGLLYAAPFSNFSAECVFLEEMMENYYNVYSSCVHGNRKRPWYVALRRTGRPRVGRKTRKRRKASHFLVVHYDEAQPAKSDQFSLAELLVPSLKHQPPQNAHFRRTIVPPSRTAVPRRKEVVVPPTPEAQRRNKKKRRRQQRLQAEEAQRRRRKEELEQLRLRELENRRDNRVTPRLSGAGLQIRPRRIPYP